MKRRNCCALLLAVCLLVTGCSGNTAAMDPAEELPCVTIQVFGGSGAEATARISQAASEITAEKLGCRVEFRFVERTDYSAELNRQRLGESLPDIFVVESQADLVEMVKGEELLCLDELLEGSALCEEIKSYEWYGTTMDGHTYAIPFNNSQPTSLGFCMRKDICDELGIDPAQITSMDQLHETLLRVKQSYPELVPVVPNYGEIAPVTVSEWDTSVYESKISSIGVLPYTEPMSETLEMITRTPAFWEWCQTLYRWSGEGLVMEDASFNQEARVSLMGAGNAFGGFVNYNASTVLNQEINVDQELCYAVLSEPYIDSGYSCLAFGISRTTEEPRLCIQVLELLYTDAGFLSLCTFGQEGVDYTLENGDYRSLLDETQRHVVNLWCWPNNRKLFDDEYRQQWQEEWSSAKVSPMMGFWFDSSACEQQAGACYQIMNRYYRALMNGEVDPDTAIPQLEKELLDAGGETVLAEMQSQFDRWTAEH